MPDPTENPQEPTPDSKDPKADSTTATAQDNKTFTQAELDKVIADRLARERSKMPADDELKAFKEWKKAQQTEVEKQKEREAEYAKLQSDTETLRKENIAYKLGVNAEDIDYVVYKVGKMDGEFEKNLKSYLEENKKFVEPKTTTVGGTQHQPSKSMDKDDVFIAAARKGAGLT